MLYVGALNAEEQTATLKWTVETAGNGSGDTPSGAILALALPVASCLVSSLLLTLF